MAGEGDRLVIVHGNCRSRLCPRCGRWRALLLREKLGKLMMKVDSPRKIEVTLQDQEGPLRPQVAHLIESFKRLRKSRSWRAHVVGGVYVIEVTLNYRTGCWHPHIHAVIDGMYYPQAKLSRDWAAASGGSKIVWIKPVTARGAAAYYLTSYVTKSQDARDCPADHLGDLAAGLHGVRMAQSWGTLHGRGESEKDPDEKGDLRPIQGLPALVARAEQGDDLAISLLGRVLDPALRAPVPSDPIEALRRRADVLALATQIEWWYQVYLGPAAEPDFATEGRPRARPPDPGLFSP
jgi:hypothetical protein